MAVAVAVAVLSLAVATCYLPQAVVAVAIFSTSVVVRLTIPELEMAAAKAGITGAGVGAALEQGV